VSNVTVNDRMQRGYRLGSMAEPGADLAPGFAPRLTPTE
jgi:hypothetical protein